MLLPFSTGMKVYLAMGNTDMRKAINGLSILVFYFEDRGRGVIIAFSGKNMYLYLTFLQRFKPWPVSL